MKIGGTFYNANLFFKHLNLNTYFRKASLTMKLMVLDLNEETLFQMIEMTSYNFPLIGTQQVEISSFLNLSLRSIAT